MCGTLVSRPLGAGPLVSGGLWRPSPAMADVPLSRRALIWTHSTPGPRPSSPPAAHQPASLHASYRLRPTSTRGPRAAHIEKDHLAQAGARGWTRLPGAMPLGWRWSGWPEAHWGGA